MADDGVVARALRAPRWLRNVSLAGLFVGILLILTMATNAVSVARLIKTMTDFLAFSQHPALRVAEQTAKSDFSDRLTRMAWRRLYWARIFGQRIVDEAPLNEINDAWVRSIEATADWNAEVMIFIVGLQQHYTLKKSRYFEFTILPAFERLDTALRAIRLSDAMRKTRSSQPMTDADRAAVKKLFGDVLDRHQNLNLLLYEFARCFKPDNPEVNVCQDQN